MTIDYTFADVLTMAKTIYGEARGECLEGQYAVGHVIVNRYKKHNAPTIMGVCLKPMQFSCWNYNDPNRIKLDNMTKNTPALQPFITIAKNVLEGAYADTTFGATHYCTGNVTPKWIQGHTPCVTIGHHRFYNDVA